jgi:thiol:disulfide interchange protein
VRTDFPLSGWLRAAILLLVASPTLFSQRLDPVQWTLSLEPSRVAPGGKVLGRFEATVEEGWYLYSATTPPGPIQTEIRLLDHPAVARYRVHQPPPQVKFDPNFDVNSETFKGTAVFLIEIELAPGAAPGSVDLTGQGKYQACSETMCLRVRTKQASATLVIDPGAGAGGAAIPAEYQLIGPAAAVPRAETSAAPVTETGQTQAVSQFLLVAFGFGLAAIFTPCVFPMIPFTMSYFLNRPGGRRDGVIQAAVFCLGIIVLFTSLGLLTTAILGPFGVVQIGSNPWVNTFIAAVFLAFGLSMLGAFELTLPSGLLTRMSQASERGGFFGVMLMGLTFSLTAFACVGPFMGTLLAASVQSGGWQPVFGMSAFASGLALPFFLLALFPAYLKRLPKSGGWLMRVKTVLGFIILAAMLKYLSNVDQVMQWNLLTRERFLAIWIVLFALPGLYLLGLLRMEGVNPEEPMGVGRTLTGAALLAFSLSLAPGMFGGRLGELDAYVPLPDETTASRTSGGPSLEWMKNDYHGALAKAREEGKLVFISFTGYACTNCHWMKANMFTRPEIAAALGGFVLVELYTDGTDAASRENQNLQETRFNTVAIPHYAIVDTNENILANFVGLTKKPDVFLAFLQKAAAPVAAARLAPSSASSTCAISAELFWCILNPHSLRVRYPGEWEHFSGSQGF